MQYQQRSINNVVSTTQYQQRSINNVVSTTQYQQRSINNAVSTTQYQQRSINNAVSTTGLCRFRSYTTPHRLHIFVLDASIGKVQQHAKLSLSPRRTANDKLQIFGAMYLRLALMSISVCFWHSVHKVNAMFRKFSFLQFTLIPVLPIQIVLYCSCIIHYSY